MIVMLIELAHDKVEKSASICVREETDEGCAKKKESPIRLDVIRMKRIELRAQTV